MKKIAYFALGSMAALAVLVVGIMATSAASDNTTPETSGLRPQWGQHMMKGVGLKFNEEHRAQMDELLQPGNYQAWKTAVESLVQDKQNITSPKLDFVTEENFDRFVEMHNLMKSGDFEGAKVIADELGLPQFVFVMFQP